MTRPLVSKEKQKYIAKERIEQLFLQAEKRRDMANRYVSLARKIAMKVKEKIPLKYKRRFCKYCHNYFNKDNSRVRITKGKVVISCFECKKFTRIPLK